mmetsp:Transcript_3575/g.5411  ORF Transcript_3575/g.5411 Transcript_3575/m.5411 type:complete len:86 (+) Transcript_3575:730-987(+)
MTQEFCEQTLSISEILNMQIANDGEVEPAAAIAVELGTIKKFNYFGDYSQELTLDEAALQAIAAPSFSAADGSCDNFALEYHLKI